MIITDIADLECVARKRLPRIISTYIENGGYEEETLHRNRSDLDAVVLVPRVLNDVSGRSLTVDMAGMSASLPVGEDSTNVRSHARSKPSRNRKREIRRSR